MYQSRRVAVVPLIGALLCVCFLVAAKGVTVQTAATSGRAVAADPPVIITDAAAVMHDTTYPSPHGHGYFCSSTLQTPYPCGDASEPFASNANLFDWFEGHYTGPSPRTEYGKSTITGSHDCGVRHCATTDVTYDPPVGMKSMKSGCGTWWWPPSWCWGDIFGAIWDFFLGPCLTGALDGFIGTASGQVIVNLLNRGGQVFVDTWGYVAIAFGNCVINVMHKATG